LVVKQEAVKQYQPKRQAQVEKQIYKESRIQVTK